MGRVAFQWVHSQRSLHGNEMAEFYSKYELVYFKGLDMSLHSTVLEIKITFRQFSQAAGDRSKSVLCEPHCVGNADVVAVFRLIWLMA
ncbi:hypothetical protein CDAR_10171 [Caerostris darwini]|uniref:Uncharacterized protein n=1 Tax=Caerostris darwini TaxID=1538125 RepID=A0AAV4RDW3_9ARAC|nr:hypothetical protein CDAR_10171 [Caerostris darwini]